MKQALEAELAALLDESILSSKEREKTAFDKLVGEKQSEGYILFGCGGLGRRTLAGLRKLGIEPHGFTDNNTSVWNMTIDGLKVFSPLEAVQKFSNDVFILTIWSDTVGHPFEEIHEQLNKIKQITLVPFTFLYWKYPDMFLPYFELDLPHKTLSQADLITSAFSLWVDDLSCKEYLAQIRLRVLGDSAGLSSPALNNQYFPDDILKINPNEIFVDCGSYDGDTFREFLKKSPEGFDQYIAYEPDPDNYNRFKEFISLLPEKIIEKISLHPFAVSDQRKRISFEALGSLQSVIKENGNISVECISLDDELINCDPTYIKMDAEGAEPEIITGAVKLIKKCLPVLAMSVYHQFDHLWKLPLMVRSLTSGYRFYLRPHGNVGWDLVCYAIPIHRQKVKE